MTDLLKQKIEYSIQLLKKAEKLAIRYDREDGFFLAFSGGKDSQALYHIAEMAGVKFKAHFSPTTVDPPQLIKFIRRNYPDVEFAKVKKNIYQVAVEKQILPSMRIRWCCAEFKENAGAGKVTLIGIRHEESARRSKRKEVEVSGRKFSGYLDQFEEWSAEQMKKKYKNLNQDQFSYDKEKEIRCINGKDSILISPIIDWTERDVWEFLNDVVKVPHCELYDKGYKRIGCILCPMSNPKQKRREMKDFPYVKEKWLQAIAEIRRSGGVLQDKPICQTRNTNGLRNGKELPRVLRQAGVFGHRYGKSQFYSNQMWGGERPTNPILWEAKYWLGTATPEEVRRMAKRQ